MVLCLCAFGVATALFQKVERVPFRLAEAWGAVRESFWEILLPLVILVMYFVGLTTLVETGAIAVLYSLLVEVAIHRDLDFAALRRIVLKCVPIIGGVLVILARPRACLLHRGRQGAHGPERLGQGQRSSSSCSAGLNVVLLIVGCLMDIFSASWWSCADPPGGRGLRSTLPGGHFLANLGGYLTSGGPEPFPFGLHLQTGRWRDREGRLPFFQAASRGAADHLRAPASTGLITLLKLWRAPKPPALGDGGPPPHAREPGAARVAVAECLGVQRGGYHRPTRCRTPPASPGPVRRRAGSGGPPTLLYLKLGQDARGWPPLTASGTSYDSLFRPAVRGSRAGLLVAGLNRRIFAAAVPIDYTRLAADCARVRRCWTCGCASPATGLGHGGRIGFDGSLALRTGC
jgi:hypothetical protein